MDKPSARGERGVSILGALVVALMLGTGAVVTFELAAPEFASVSESQTAAAPKTTAAPKNPFKAKQEDACKKRIKESAAAGQPTNTDKVVLTKEKGKDAETSDDENTGKKKESDGTEATVDLCISVQKSATHSEKTKNKESSYECRGRLAEVKIDNRSTVTSQSSPYAKALKGECVTLTCKPDPKNPGKLDCTPHRYPSGYNLRDALRIPADAPKIKLDAADLDAKGIGTTLNAQENDAIQAAIEEAEGKKEAAKSVVEQKENDLKKALDDLTNCPSPCANKGALETAKKNALKELAEAKKKYQISEEELDKLEDARVYLSAKSGPPKDGEVVEGPCPGGGSNCSPEVQKVEAARRKLEKDLQEARNRGQQTFGDPGGQGNKGGAGGLGDMFKGSGGGNKPQPQAGNGMPQAPGSCNPSVICGNNTLYSRNNQCVDTVMQQCQYGCSGNQCSQQQGAQCLPAPQQPDPSGCTNGTWKPTYGGQNNTCVVGWQCTSGTGGGNAPTAQLSCQPRVADVGMELSITYSCSAGTSVGSGFNTNGAQSGSATTTITAPPGDTNMANFGLTCTNEGRSGSAQCSVQVAKPGIVLVANPKSVVSGKTSALGWVTSGMQTCIISSSNLPDFTSQNANITNVNGTATTPPLTATNSATTTYNFLLNCTTLGGGTRQASTTVTATP